MIRCILYIVAGILATGLIPVSIAWSCSCLDYMEIIDKPTWVDKESIERKHYLSFGVTYCTGVKSVDINHADKQARARLARMIQTDISTHQEYIVSDLSHGVSLEKFNEQTNISTQLTIDEAVIYDHWVSGDNCSLYAAISVTKAAVAKAIERQSQQLAKQVFYFDSVPVELQQIVNQTKVKVTTKKDSSDVLVLSNVEYLAAQSNTKAEVKLTVQLVKTKNQQLLWQHMVKGKGISFEPEELGNLQRKAKVDAFDRIKDTLINIIKNKQIN